VREVRDGLPRRLISRPLQALLPQAVKVPTLLREAGRSRPRQGQRGGFKRGEGPLTDEDIARGTGEILASVPPLAGR
jgi:hypothetical protein